MNSNAILTSDVLDILFERRNKDYGAYPLRKFYPGRIKTSLFIMLGMAAVFCAFTFLPDKKISATLYTIYNGDMIVKQLDKIKEPEQPKPKPKVAVSTAKFVSTMNIVKNDSTDVLNDITDLRIGTETIILPGETSSGIVEPSTQETAIEPVKIVEPEINNQPVDNPDIQASYPGGQNALLSFLQKNLRSPSGLEEGESVQVRIKFVVDFDGNLQSFDVLQDGGADFNNEVIRVLKKMPQWNPGKKGGKNVPVYYALPVKFAGAE